MHFCRLHAAGFSSSRPRDCILISAQPSDRTCPPRPEPYLHISPPLNIFYVTTYWSAAPLTSISPLTHLSLSSFSFALWNAFQLSVPFLYFYGNHNSSLIGFPPLLFSPPPSPFCKKDSRGSCWQAGLLVISLINKQLWRESWEAGLCGGASSGKLPGDGGTWESGKQAMKES